MSTVTYMTGGSNRHEDFMGNAGLLETGDVQWMTAGRGIMHAEMPSFDEDPAKVEPAVGIQLWVDLPAKNKMCEPTYQEKKAKE
jgi:redox-sensitive bicupin YhaK (pirin superfamily)